MGQPLLEINTNIALPGVENGYWFIRFLLYFLYITFMGENINGSNSVKYRNSMPNGRYKV